MCVTFAILAREIENGDTHDGVPCGTLSIFSLTRFPVSYIGVFVHLCNSVFYCSFCCDTLEYVRRIAFLSCAYGSEGSA